MMAPRFLILQQDLIISNLVQPQSKRYLPSKTSHPNSKTKTGCKGRNEYVTKSVSYAGSGVNIQHDGVLREDIFSTHQSRGVFQRI